MTVKNTYWLIGPENTFARVEGAEKRDECSAAGWTPTEEPSDGSRVWMRHDVTQATALFPHAALEAWQARGWEFTVPPTQNTDQGPLVVLDEPAVAAVAVTETEPVEPVAVATPVTADKPNSEKEQTRGR